jgi:anti-sigma factor (TIGR02949 family)
MKCSVVKDLLTAYVDSELSDETQAQIDAHLEECESCRKEMQAQMGVHRLLSEKLERAKADPELRNRVISKTLGQNPVNGLWFFRKLSLEIRPVTGFAIAALLVFAFLSKDMFFEQQQLNPIKIENASTELVSMNDGVETSVVGKLVCVGCYLKKHYGAKHDCKLHGHKLGIVMNDGSIWSFTDTDLSDLICGDMELEGKTIRLDGKVFYSAHFIDIKNYTLMEGNEE